MKKTVHILKLNVPKERLKMFSRIAKQNGTTKNQLITDYVNGYIDNTLRELLAEL